MNIGVVSRFNPSVIAEFLDENNVPFMNNSASAVNTLVRALLQEGHKLKIFTSYDYDTAEYRVIKGRNVTIFMIPKIQIPSYLKGFGLGIMTNLIYPRNISKVIQRELEGLDVLHAHWTYEYAVAASAFSKKIPVYVTVRDWCPYQVSIQKGVRAKVIWAINSYFFNKVTRDSNITFIANSGYTFSMLKNAFPEKNFPIIPNPIEKSWILSEKTDKTIKHRFISIAYVIEDLRKNIGVLLEAFVMYRKKYSDAELHLVGMYDRQSNTFKDWQSRNLLEGVVIHGKVAHDELAGLLDKMTCLVHPALEETFGNILIEAMSRGVVCIGGYESGAVGEVLGHGEYGLVCDITSATSIYESMARVNDSAIYSGLITKSLDMVRKIYSSDIIAREHIALFEANKIPRPLRDVLREGS